MDLSSEAASIVLQKALFITTNLRGLSLNGCRQLVFIPQGLCRIDALQYVGLEGCESLAELPSSVGNWRNSRGKIRVDIRGCPVWILDRWDAVKTDIM